MNAVYMKGDKVMKSNGLTKLGSILLICCMMLGFAGCAAAPSDKTSDKVESKLESIKKAGKIVVGTCADYPPYEFHKEINKRDQIVGFDITLANEIAKDLGVALEIKDMKFEGLLPALQTGNVDFVTAGMNPTPARAKKVDFSKVYYVAVQSVVVRAEDADKITSIEDLKGKVVGGQKGATQEEIIKEQMPDSQLKALGKISDLMLALKNKRLDAVVVELPVANAYVNKNPDLKVLDERLKVEDSGSAVAVKKGNKELLEEINKTLDRLIKDKSIDQFVTEATEMVE
jgi:ABC-type amino acid transport substrate-binding protein